MLGRHRGVAFGRRVFRPPRFQGVRRPVQHIIGRDRRGRPHPVPLQQAPNHAADDKGELRIIAVVGLHRMARETAREHHGFGGSVPEPAPQTIGDIDPLRRGRLDQLHHQTAAGTTYSATSLSRTKVTKRPVTGSCAPCQL